MNNVKKELFTNIEIKAGDGFHVIRIPPQSGKDAHRAWRQAKSWCRKSCAYTWAFSQCVRKRDNDSRLGKQFESYFAFADKQDMLLFKLYFSDINTMPLWHSKLQFDIIVFKY